ncbi:MAG: aminoglycoside phosphotransferase, partial [Muribaculaceae bacterium]|nr:aminoglycoside phosphotransferase [Muribaculaceae bacterium]
MKQQLSEIVSLFNIEGTPEKITPLGNGLINDTFLVATSPDTAPDYVLQRINHSVFKNVELLQQNIMKVTNHIRRCLQKKNAEDADRRTLTLIPAKDGSLFVKKDNNFWRMTVKIPESFTFESVPRQMAERTGPAFGAV